MATTIVMGSGAQIGRDLVDLMHRLRARPMPKWHAWSPEERPERDRYDTADAKYVLLTDGSDQVVGAARLLPTTSIYPLPDLFPQLLAGRAAPRDPGTWELSRLTTSVDRTRDGRVLTLSESTLELLELVFDLARQHNVDRLLLVASIGIERLMLRAGLEAHRLGPPASVDGELCVALFIEVPEEERSAAWCRASAPRRRLDSERVLESVDAAEPLAAIRDSNAG